MRVVSSKKKYKRGSWSKQEDEKLVDYINTHGEASCSWATLPKAVGLERHGKSCRLRWLNYLRPDIKRGNFSLDEEDLIIKLHALLHNKWSLIAGRIPGRTENEVKNHWNSHIKRKLIRAGIDPNNHSIHQKLPISSSVINDGDEALSKITTKNDGDEALSKITTKNDGDEALSKITTKNDGDEAVSSHFQTVLRPRAYSFLQRPSSPDTHEP